MALFFISGASGTGKTTLMYELLRRGEEAHDTDTVCIRLSKQTGKLVNYEASKKEGYDWIYPHDALMKLKEQSLAKNVFLLGSVDNFDEVKATADEYIWMNIPLTILGARLDDRGKEYGKSKSERQSIMDLYEKMTAENDPTLFSLDATKPVELIADDLLAHVGTYSKTR